jgi:hypothetical protein
MVTLGYLEYREGRGLRNAKRDQIELDLDRDCDGSAYAMELSRLLTLLHT